jgi:hypothetical protein
MSSTFKSWSIAALALCALALTVLASAQTQPWATYKGSNGRPGNNGNPLLDNPGAANLRWFQPFLANYSDLNEDNESNQASFLGTWLAANQGFQNAASTIYTYNPTGNAIQDALVGINSNVPWFYSPVVPADFSGNPLNVQAGYTGSLFTWMLNNNNLGNVAADYSLWVDIPAGPNVDILNNYTYQPEFYVFLINYATGAQFVDVVDTHASNYGWETSCFTTTASPRSLSPS